MNKEQNNQDLGAFLYKCFLILYSHPIIRWVMISLVILLFVYTLAYIVDTAKFLYDVGYEIGSKK